MIELTPDARVRLEAYLQRMRHALRGTRAVEPAEVEQSVREHVELALAGAPAPVGADRLAAVLDQLGAPERWLPDDERSWWRRALGYVMDGPEDWRLPYLSFAFTTLSIVFLPVGGALLLIPAFILGRAWVSLMKERGEPLDARRWLIFPPIVLFFLLFLAGALVSVIGLGVALSSESDLRAYGIPRPPGGDAHASEVVAFIGYVMTVAGGWWLVLSGLLAFLFEPIRHLFAPLLDNARRRHLLGLVFLAAVCLAIGMRLLYIA